MDNKAILEEIAKQVAVLEQHIGRLKNKSESLHDIDVEVMGEKVKEIYTLIHTLEPGEKEIEVKAPVVQEVEKVPLVEVKPEPEIPAPKAPDMSSEVEEERTPKNEHQATNTEPPASDPEPPAPSAQPPASDPEPPSPIPEPPAPSNHPPAPSPELPAPDTEPTKTTADLFSGPKTIADSFQAEEDNSIAATVNPQPTQDLKLAIGINDKFLFINELFQGDPSKYNQAIENMNAAGGLVQALSTLDGYRAEYNWADNSEAYHRLKKIVNSKYNG